MQNRGDFNVFLEPFGKSAYYSPDRIFHIELDAPLDPGYSYGSVLGNLKDSATEGNVFVKDFPLYFSHIIDDSFLSVFQHSFLIRHPEQMLPSYFQKWPTLTFEETGYRQLFELFEQVMLRDGKAPPVVDSDDLVTVPQDIVQVYCDKVGIPFIAESLNWDKPQTAVKEMCWWDKGSWHDSTSASTGFTQKASSTSGKYTQVNENPHLQELYDLCMPYYEKLYQYRIQVPS